MHADMDSIGPLKKALREDIARFSGLLQPLMVKYDPRRAARHDKSTYAGFQKELGHTSKEMAYAFGRIDGAVKYEPTITESEIIQETLRKYTDFAADISAVAARYGIDRREIAPLMQVIADSVHRCEEALEKAGGPRLRRSFKFELCDLLGSENALIATAQKYVQPDEATKQAQLEVFQERVLPDLAKIYSLPGLVATGKLDFSDAAKTLARIKDGYANLSQSSRGNDVAVPMVPVLAPIMKKLDAALELCQTYAREDYQSRGPGRSAG